jgi:uncharacterized protein YcbX
MAGSSYRIPATVTTSSNPIRDLNWLSMSIEVASLKVYPVKSLRPNEPDSIAIERRGLQHDRRWMVTDEKGVFRTRREIPRMAQINAKPNGDHLILSKDGMKDLHVPLMPTGASKRVQIWNAITTGRHVSSKADEWLTEAIGEPSQLVYMSNLARRKVSPSFNSGKDVLGFSDAFPILVASEASIEDLNSRLDSAIPIQRFRPNIVLRGPGAFEEDTWKSLKIGEVVLRAARPCIRCLVTTQDPLTGEAMGQEPLRTLATYRKVEGGVIFGMYYIPEKLGNISVGDVCQVS